MPKEVALKDLFEKPGFVSIWAGTFSTREVFDRYFEEHISDDENSVEQPLNNFAADIGFGYYDHDYQEADFNERGEVTLTELFAPFSYSASYLKQIVEAGDKLGISQANAAVILMDCQYQGSTKQDSPLKFFGAFQYNRNA